MRNTRYADQCPKPLGDSDFSMRNNKVSLDNAWEGCQKAGPGCDHCYAETRNVRFGGGTAINWGPGAPRRRTSEANRRKPLRWNAGHDRFFAEHGRRQRVFCESLGDWLDNAVPVEWLVDLLDTIRVTQNLDWLLLSKRIGNWQSRLEAASDHAFNHRRDELHQWIAAWLDGRAPQNVRIGATVCDQKEADRDIPKLLQVPALVRFLSMEPLLGPVDIADYLVPGYPNCQGFEQGNQMESGYCGRCGGHVSDSIHDRMKRDTVDWVIVGGESGPAARPMHPEWARCLRDQCASHNVPFMFKQHGEWAPGSGDFGAGRYETAAIARDGRVVAGGYEAKGYPGGSSSADGWTMVHRAGKKAAGRLLDGVQHDGFPTLGGSLTKMMGEIR